MGVSDGVWECGKPKRFSIISMPQSEGEKGVSDGVWECGKPKRFSIISMPQSEGEKGEVTFSLRPRRGRSLAPPFPPVGLQNV